MGSFSPLSAGRRHPGVFNSIVRISNPQRRHSTIGFPNPMEL